MAEEASFSVLILQRVAFSQSLTSSMMADAVAVLMTAANAAALCEGDISAQINSKVGKK